MLFQVECHCGRSSLSKAALDLTEVVIATLVHELGFPGLEPLAFGESDLTSLELAHVATMVLEKFETHESLLLKHGSEMGKDECLALLSCFLELTTELKL